jgi:hypothetical protein
MSLLLSRAFVNDPWTRKLLLDDTKKSQAFFTMIIQYCKATGGQVLFEHQGTTLQALLVWNTP